MNDTVAATSALVEKYQGKTVCVYGLGRAGVGAISLLLKAEAIVWAFDDNAETCAKVAEQFGGNDKFSLRKAQGKEWRNVESLIFSPGIPLYAPTIHPVAQEAQKYECPVICDVELLYYAYPDAKFVGITGTNGKSTATNLLYHVLKKLDKNVAVGGNIGVAASSIHLEGDAKIFVIEMSSYQCDLIEKMVFDVTMLLNITPDHIDRHGSMAGYIVAKERIFKRQEAQHTAIVAVDDDYTRLVAKRLTEKKCVNTLFVSGYGSRGVKIRYDGERIVDHDTIHSLGKIELLPGQHNAQNIACVYAALRALGLPYSTQMRDAFRCYEPLAHRLQVVAKYSNVVFVNDSKATNAVAAEQALRSYDNILWIAGGVAKEGGIDSLKPYFTKVKCAFLIGKAAHEFHQSLAAVQEKYKCHTLKDAMADIRRYCERHPEEKHVVLLSPACASFDQYPSFEARGDDFIHLAKKIVEEWRRED